MAQQLEIKPLVQPQCGMWDEVWLANIYDLVKGKQLIVTAAAVNDEIHGFKFPLSLKLSLLCFSNDAFSCVGKKAPEGGRLAISLIKEPCPAVMNP